MPQVTRIFGQFQPDHADQGATSCLHCRRTRKAHARSNQFVRVDENHGDRPERAFTGDQVRLTLFWPTEEQVIAAIAALTLP